MHQLSPFSSLKQKNSNDSSEERGGNSPLIITHSFMKAIWTWLRVTFDARHILLEEAVFFFIISSIDKKWFKNCEEWKFYHS